MRLLLLGTVLSLALVGCDGGKADDTGAVEADCADGADDDGDGRSDCYDSDCAAETACLGEFSCDDGVDNDGNGAADCADGACADAVGCFEADCADGTDDDGDGWIDCYDSDCAGETACLGEFSCDDGVDNDGNGAADCADGACATDPACVETDCTDGADSDGDGLVDCADSDCVSDGACLAACADGDLGAAVGEAVVTGSTDGMADDFVATGSACGGSDAEDVAYVWEAPAAGSYAFSTAGSGFDTVVRLYATCAGDELACDDDVTPGSDLTSSACLDVAVGDALLVVVDGFSTSGDYVLNVSAVAACAETACDDGVDNDEDGATDCEDFDCFGTAVCYEADCTDGLDDDGDGLTDCADADCVWEPTCVETNCTDGLDDEGDGAIDCADSDCAGETACEEGACDDGLDDDGDGDVDCDDDDCATDAACPGACIDADLGSVVGDAVATGSNAGLGDVFDGSCTAGTGASDYAYTWTAPADGCYTFDTSASDYDTVLIAYDGCGGAELACDDDTSALTSEIEVTLAAGDTIVLVVDGYSVYSEGTWVLDITEGC